MGSSKSIYLYLDRTLFSSIISYMKQYSSTNFIHTAGTTADLNDESYRRRLLAMQKDLQSIRNKLDKYEVPLCEMAKNMKNDLSQQNLFKIIDEEDHKREKDKNEKGFKYFFKFLIN
jgi:hypothetical protein